MPTDSSAAGIQADSVSTGLPQESGLDLNLDIARSLRMRRGVAIAAGALTFLLIVFYGLTRKPVFEATNLIYVEPVVPKAVTDSSAGLYDASRYDAYIQQQLLTLTRADIIGQAIDQLSPAIRSSLSPNREVAIRQVAQGLHVERQPGSYLIKVSMQRAEPASVAPIANAVAAAYLKIGQQDELAINEQQVESLMQERQRIQEELEKDRQEQASLSGALGVADTNGYFGNPFDSELADLRGKLADARSAHAIAEAQLAAVNSKTPSPGTADSVADPLVRNDVELGAMRATLGSRRAALISEMNGLTPENPQYKKDQAELATLSQSIDSLTNEVSRKSSQATKSQLKLEADRTGDVLARLEADFARQTAAATADAPRVQRAQDLAESIRLLQARYAAVDNAFHSVAVDQNPGFAAHISLMATPPSSPLPSKKPLMLALALPLSFFAAMGAAVVRQKLDPHIYIGRDVDRLLSFSPMTVLPDSDEVGYQVAEEFLFRLVAGLDQAHRVGMATTFVFTAASKETRIDDLVTSIAAEMERLGYRTMSLSASETLSPVELEAKTAISDWRAGSELVRSTGGGTGMQLRRESVIDEHLERLKQKVDFLFIRAQPIRVSSETEFVVRLGELTVLVAESGRTTRHELRSCLALIRRIRARGVAVVVADLKLRNADNEFKESVRFAGRREKPERSGKFADGMVTIGRL